MMKKANQLRIGDKILGNTNTWTIQNMKNSGLYGTRYPVIEVIDMMGKTMSIETGANEKLQDHEYEVDPYVAPVVVEKPKKKTAKKTKKKK